jgi:hypothetical protein
VPGPPPKPGAIRRNKPTLGEWIELPPEGRKGPPPPLPSWRNWHVATREAWAGWWSTPQATQWDPSGRSLWRWLLLFDRLMTEPDAPVTIHTQLAALEDRHGFTRKAMVQLRWRLREDEPAPRDPGTRAAERAAVAARMRRVN